MPNHYVLELPDDQINGVVGFVYIVTHLNQDLLETGFHGAEEGSEFLYIVDIIGFPFFEAEFDRLFFNKYLWLDVVWDRG